MSLFRRFFSVMSFLGLVPLGVASLQMIHVHSLAQQTLTDYHRFAAQTLAARIDDFFAHLNMSLGFVSALENEPAMPSARKEKLLTQALLAHPEWEGAALFDETGEVAWQTGGSAFALPPAEKTKEARSAHHAIMAPFFGRNKKTFFHFYYPLESSTQVVALQVDVGTLLAALKALKIGQTGEALVLDENGEVVLPLGSNKGMLKDAAPWKALMNRSLSSGGDFSRLPVAPFRDTGKRQWVGAAAGLENNPWMVLVRQERREVFGAVDAMKRGSLFWMLVALSGALGGAFALARHIAGPLQNMTRAATAVSQGRFGEKVPEAKSGELALLTRTFNQMSAKLKAYDDMQVEKIVTEKAKLEAILESISDGIAMINNGGEIVFFNKQMAALLGVGGWDVSAKDISAFLEYHRLGDDINRVLLGRNHLVTRELELKQGGQEKDLLIMIFPIRGAGKPNVGIIVLNRDITIQKSLERMREEFFHAVTHDMKNPLGAVLSFLTAMKQGLGGELNPTLRNWVQTMETATSEVFRMVNNILDLARFNHNMMKLLPVAVDLKELFVDAVDPQKIRAKMRGLTLEWHLPEGLTEAVLDKELMNRLLNNLVVNALKFTPMGGKIDVHARKTQEGGVEFIVEDTGRGIPPDRLNNLFKKFQQVQIHDQSLGSGLGLSNCRHVAEAHGGTIEVFSEMDKGTKFVVKIPKLKPVAAGSAA